MPEVHPLWDVTGVVVIGDHKLRLLFEDGTAGDVSFEGREWTGIFEPLRRAGQRSSRIGLDADCAR